MNKSGELSRFITLPSELRTKIWRHALPPSRIVAVRYSRHHQQYTTDKPTPILLQVCSESRNLFLSRYEKLILSPEYDSAVYVNFERDTIFFDSMECSPRGDLALDLATSPQRNKILQCAIDAQLWEVLRIFRFDSSSEIKLLQNLKTVSLVLRQDPDQSWRHRTDETGATYVEADFDTIGSEIRHVHWSVETLRWDLEHEEIKWLNGRPPIVQMWIL